MTLPSSGGLTVTEILAEIGDSFPVTIPNANWRILADKPSGSLVIPTDFYGKSWQKFQFQNTRSASGAPPNLTVTDMEMGTAVTGRRVFCTIHWVGEFSGTQTLDSCTLDGNALTIHVQRSNQNTLTDETVGVAIASAVINTGTVGDFVATFNGGTIALLRVGTFFSVNLAGIAPRDTDTDIANEGTKPATIALNVATNDLVLSCVTLDENTETVTFTGPDTEAYAENQREARYQVFSTADASFDISATWASGDFGMALCGLSWQMI